MKKQSGTPHFSGDVEIRRTMPKARPAFDTGFKVAVEKVKPSQVPGLKSGEPVISRVKPQHSTFDNSHKVTINKHVR